MLHVESARYFKDYKLEVTFNDGSSHLVDLQNTIFSDVRPIITNLKDLSLFKDFTIKNHTISWSNGLDFAPEFLRDCSIKRLDEIA